MSARHLWAEAILAGRDLEVERFEITDEMGHPLLTILFREALPPSLRGS